MSLGDPALVARAKAIAAACSTQQSPCRRNRCRRRSLTRECRGSWRRRRQTASRLWSGFRHLRHEADVNAQRCASCLFPSFGSTKLVKAILRLLESRGLESTILDNAVADDESAVAQHVPWKYSNPQLSKLFRNASPKATFPRTDHSTESYAATNASASLIDLTDSTAVAT